MIMADATKTKKNAVFFARSVFLLFLSVILLSCVKSNEKKREFIVKKQAKTNERVAKKYGELVIPVFVKEGDYEFDKFQDDKNEEISE